MDVADEPRVLGPYVLLSPLAQGGMGTVFIAAPVAHDADSDRPLCLVKTLKTGMASVSDYRPRFIDESKIAVLLRHENLCQVFGGGEAGGEFYLAMELIEGLTFKRLLSLLQLKEKQLSNTQATALAIGLLRGLHAAHTTRAPDGGPLGVVHRDVSPHNVMVDVQGRIKVIDFGLATSVLKETFTESAVVLGKSAYMAPEQARGEDLTPAVDQYAAAIVIYELLTDDRFYGELPSRAIWSVVGAGSHKPRAWAEVPAEFVPILQRALSPKAADRFADCGAFADALTALVPDALLPETAQSLGSVVRRLKPDELDAIAVARVQLAAWDQPKRPAPAVRVARVDRAPSVDPSSSDDPPTAETSSTVMNRPAALVPRRRAAPIAAATAVVLLTIAVVVGALLRPSPAPAPPIDPTPAAPATTTHTEPTPTPTIPTTPIPTTAEATTTPTTPTPPTTTTTKAVDGGRQRLLRRLDALKGCPDQCVVQLRQVPRALPNTRIFASFLTTCEAKCSAR